MKKIKHVFRVILTCLAIILFACMAMGSVDFPWAPEDEYPSVIDNRREAEARVARDRAKVDDVNSEIMRCTGKNLTSEEMSQHIKEFEKVQKKWSKKEIESESTAPTWTHSACVQPPDLPQVFSICPTDRFVRVPRATKSKTGRPALLHPRESARRPRLQPTPPLQISLYSFRIDLLVFPCPVYHIDFPFCNIQKHPFALATDDCIWYRIPDREKRERQFK